MSPSFTDNVSEFIKCKKIYCLFKLAPRLLFAGGEHASEGGGGVASEAPSSAALSTSWSGDDSRTGGTSPSPRPSPLRSAGGGGWMLRRNLSAHGAVASQLHWLACNQTPPRSTGTVSPATPGVNQDVGSCSSWDGLREIGKSAKYSKIKIHAKYSRSAGNNT